MGSKIRVWTKGLASGLVLGLCLLLLLGAKPRKDPAGTTLYMGQLRIYFAKWDANGDGSLSQAELARAFRGDHAKQVLAQLDQNNDGKVSREEYLTWAREYAVLLKKQAAVQEKLLGAQDKLAAAQPGSKQFNLYQGKAQRHSQTLQGMQGQMKTLEKLLQAQQKHQQLGLTGHPKLASGQQTILRQGQTLLKQNLRTQQQLEKEQLKALQQAQNNQRKLMQQQQKLLQQQQRNALQQQQKLQQQQQKRRKP